MEHGVATPSGTFTAEEFGRLPRPPCPICGTPVDFDRLDVTTREHFDRTGERLYMAGRWSCPHDCDPVAGERRHFNRSSGNDIAGLWFTCSCGFEERGITAERLSALEGEHR